MKRAILILAAAALVGAAGCGRRCDATSLTVNWQFTDAGGVVRGCSDSGTSFVRAFLNGQVQVDEFGNTDFSCVRFPDGFVLFDLAGGSYALELQGFNANGQEIFLDQETISTSSCGDTVVLANLSALTGNLAIDFQFTDIGFTCTNTNTFIWYELLDRNNLVVDIVGPNNTPLALPCSQGPILLNALAFGSYTVSRIQEVEPVGGGFVSHHATCTPQTFQHFANGETVTVLVPPSSGTCF